MTQDISRKASFDPSVGAFPDAKPGFNAAAPTAPYSAQAGLSRNPLELLTRIQVEDEYGIKVKALERYAWAGGGPPMVKLGHRTVRYRRGDIEAFINAHLDGG